MQTKNQILDRPKLSRATFFCKIWLIFCISIYSQEYKVEYITPQDGLAHGCVQDIIQDSKGFMWFATEGGLNRYDGYNIRLYDCGEKFIQTIFEDPADNGKTLWIGSRDGGLFKFDRDSETFLQFKHNPNDSNSISANSVRCIYKCKNGDFWIGTNGGGLNKFDRIKGKYIHYRNNPNDPNTLSSDNVHAICEDYQGFLWVGTWGGGLNKFDPKTKIFTQYKYDPRDSRTLPSFEIWSLYEDHNKVLWIGGSRGLFKYDREKDLFIRNSFGNSEAEILNYRFVTSIMEDDEQTLWIAAQDCGVVGVSKNRKEIRYFKYNPDIENTLNSSIIFSAVPDHSGNIWVGSTCSGINKIVPGGKSFHYYDKIPYGSKSYQMEFHPSLFEDKDGALWIGTGGGLFRFKDNKFKHFQFDDWFYDNIFRIRQSGSGKLLIARGRALTELDPETEKFTNYFGKHQAYSLPLYFLCDSLFKASSKIAAITGVPNNSNVKKEFIIDKDTDVFILCVGEGDTSELFDYGWITSEKKEIIWEMKADKARYAGGNFNNRVQLAIINLPGGKYQIHYKSNETHAYNKVIGEAPIKTEWWGISLFPISSAVAKTLRKEIETENFVNLHWIDLGAVEEDNSGNIWCYLMQSTEPIYYFDRKKKQFIPFKLVVNDTLVNGVKGFFKDRSGYMWFTTEDNMFVKRDQNGKNKIMFGLNDLLKDSSFKIKKNAINYLYQDSKGIFWIATEFGIIKYDFVKKNIIHYNFKDLNYVKGYQGIIEDDYGNLWISSDTELFKFNPVKRSIRKYGKYDGVPDINYSIRCCVKRKNGYIAIGGANGFIMFHQDSIKENLKPPPVFITDFQLFNKSLKPGKNSPLKKAISESDKIVLSYNQDVFTFEFAALDYTLPQLNRYAYKMEGVDPDWVYTDASKRFATYTKLPPGEYIFRVKGSNNDGIWNEEGASLLIIITPPWWATWWFRTILLLTFLGIGYTIYRYRINKVREVERLRIQIASDLHDDIGSALTRIAVHSEIIGTTSEKSKVLRSSKQIGTMSREMITTLSDVVWSIDSRNDTVGDLIDRMRDFLDTVFPAGSIHIDFQTKGLHFEQKLEQAIRQNIYLIFKEAVNNAAKHSSADEIKISLINGSGRFKMEISDNGKGMDEEEKHKGHHGIENMKLRAEKIGGELSISHPEKGTSVVLIAKSI